MQGTGNDYIVIDNRKNFIKDSEVNSLACKLCERRYSIGADGLLLVYRSTRADVKMRIFNSDGSEAEMCGNGIRCFAKYCYERGIVKKSSFSIETLAGIIKVWLMTSNNEVKKVKVNIGKPILERHKIPMQGKGKCINELLTIGREKLNITCLSVGNPHCVILVDNAEDFPVEKIGPRIENHKIFPKRVNVEFVQILSRKEIKMRVWERGCGETLACGTGACAGVVAGNLLNKLSKNVVVHLPGGELLIEFSENIFMTGSVEKIFEGKLF